jgi:hypothetical protein
VRAPALAASLHSLCSSADTPLLRAAALAVVISRAPPARYNHDTGF